MNVTQSLDNTQEKTNISIIAQGLNIQTFQGLIEINDGFLMPNTDSELLQITPKGEVSTLVKLCDGFECTLFGVPYGITSLNENIILSTSLFEWGGRLVQLAPDKTVKTLADFSPLIPQGGLFGITTKEEQILVTAAFYLSQKKPKSALFIANEKGNIDILANLSPYGIPFDIKVSNNTYLTTQEKGQLLRISQAGQIVEITNLVTANLGIPLGIAEQSSGLFATTNQGLIVKVTPDGQSKAIADTKKANFGVPSGIISSGDSLIVTTIYGFLLRINL